jgi:hypothetical protein
VISNGNETSSDVDFHFERTILSRDGKFGKADAHYGFTFSSSSCVFASFLPPLLATPHHGDNVPPGELIFFFFFLVIFSIPYLVDNVMKSSFLINFSRPFP